jgi:hypothetical protein
MMGIVGNLRQSVENQFDNTPGGGIFDPSESTRELAEATEGDVGSDNQFDDTAIDNQFDDDPGGGIFDPSESTRELAEATEGDVGPDNQFDNTAVDNQFDDEPGGGFADTATDSAADAAAEARDVAFNIGPDWLDEAAIVGVVVLTLGALLWLARPLLGIAEGVSS